MDRDCIECVRKHTCERSLFRKRAEGYRNDAAMKKALKISDDIVQKGNMKRYKLTPFEFLEFSHYVHDLWEWRAVMVIDEKLKELLVKCGFEAVEDGIGWIVS